MAKTLNSALSTIYDHFVFTGSERSEFFYTNGIGGDDAQVTALQLTTLRNVDNEAVLTTDSSQDVSLANDLKLLSDSSVLSFGTNSDVKLTHVHNTGLLLTQDGSGSIPVLQIRDTGLTIGSSADGQLDIDADTELELGSATIDINATTACEIDNTNTTNGVKVGVNTSSGKVFIGHTTSETTVNDNLTVTGTITANSTVALNDDVTLPHGKKIIFDSADTYIYANTDDPEDLVIGADADIILEPDGNVGIRTTAPDNLLEINHTITTAVTGANIADNTIQGIHIDHTADTDTAGSVLKFSSNSDGCQSAIAHIQVDDNDADLAFYTDNAGTLTEAMRIDDSQNVGIGTDSPISLLEIQGGLTTTGAILSLGTEEPSVVADDVLGRINFYAPLDTGTDSDEIGASIAAVAQATFSDSVNKTSLYFQTGKSEVATTKMVIDEDGYVGIGIVQPTSPLNVVGGNSSGIRLYNSNGSTIIGKLEGDGNQDGCLTLNQADGTANVFLSGQDGDPSYFLTGELFLGTDSGVNNYEITCQKGVSGGADMSNGTSAAMLSRGIGDWGSAYGIFGVRYNSSADTDAACGYARLDAPYGQDNYLFVGNDDKLYITTDIANVGIAGNSTIVGTQQASDERLKNISSDPFPYGLAEVNAITPIQFTYKNVKVPTNALGFGAQTIQSIVPECIMQTTDCIDGYNKLIDESNLDEVRTPKSNNNKMNMEYHQLIPVLVKAIQELSAKVEALENA